LQKDVQTDRQTDRQTDKPVQKHNLFSADRQKTTDYTTVDEIGDARDAVQ